MTQMKVVLDRNRAQFKSNSLKHGWVQWGHDHWFGWCDTFDGMHRI